MSNPYNLEGLIEQSDDIISSGMGWGNWHEKQLTKLFKEVEPALRKRFVKEYYEGPVPAEGVTNEELTFMCNMLNVVIKPKFMPKDED